MGFDWLPPKKYKRHYLCLRCQKGFKRPPTEEMKHRKTLNVSKLMEVYYQASAEKDIVAYIRECYELAKVVCPQCQDQMIQVHYNFELPPQRDHKSWRKLRENLSIQNEITYKNFISWHQQALQEKQSQTIEDQPLQVNLEKLIKAQKILDQPN